MSDTCSLETCDVASGLDDFNVSTSSLDAAPFADPSPNRSTSDGIFTTTPIGPIFNGNSRILKCRYCTI